MLKEKVGMSQSKTEDRSATPAGSLRTAYSIAAGAAAMAAGAANAEIVYSGVQDLSINQFSALNLDLDLDGSGDLLLKNYVFGGGNYMGATVNFYPGKLVTFTVGASYPYVASLATGFQIDAAAMGSFFGSMAYGAVNPNAQFNSTQGAILGVSFGSGANLFYGWVRVSIDQAAGSFVVNDWAYENQSGVGIAAGVVPAPGVLGLLAAGAAGLGLMRSRRRED
jgi:hypothetical protein